jgi:hypothetical protein
MWNRLKKIMAGRPAPEAEKAADTRKPGAAPERYGEDKREIYRRNLPRVFQRTAKSLRRERDPGSSRPPAGAAARPYSEDEADTPALPDIYSVSDIVPAAVFDWFGAHSFIGHQMCAILAQHWLIDKACGQAPRDAARNGFLAQVTRSAGEAPPPELIQKINERDQEMDILGQCREFSRNARIFGIRHALFLAEGLDYEAPFNVDGVKPRGYKGISQIDPYWLAPEFDEAGISDPAGRHFYEPTWWRLPNGQRVHRSHFVILREGEVPDVLKPTYYYGGLPLPQLIFERVYAAERTANEAPELALTKRLITMRANMDNYLTEEGVVTERLAAFNRLRSNYGFLVVGEDENIQQIDTALADFDALIMTQYQLVAAIARTPATKLLGTTPKGFNATGEYESDSYDQELASLQGDMTPLLDRHHLLLCRSEFADYSGLSVKAVWNPVRAPKPLEKADMELKEAQAAQTRVAAEITSPEEERARLMANPESGYSGPELGEEADGLEEIPGGASMDGDFEENRHPRAKDGKFGQGGGGKSENGTSKAQSTSPEEKQRKIDSIKIDFDKDNTLPGLNAEDLSKQGKADKPVLLKKSIIDRNLERHPDISKAEYNNLIGKSLYDHNEDFPGFKDGYVNLVSRLNDRSNSLVLVEMAESKDNYEIVHIMKINSDNLRRMQKIKPG